MAEQVMVITTSSCDQCKMVKMMLDKENMKYNEIVHIEPFHDDYPIIYMNNKRLCYRDFLTEMKEIKKGEKP